MHASDRLFLSPPHMGGSEHRYVNEVFATNWIAPAGPMIERFEADLSILTGMSEVVALSSGTAALHLALRIGGVGAGDEVWGSTLTFIGGVAPILYQDAVPVFFDVDPATLLLDLDVLQQALEDRQRSGERLPKAVITTDLYGNAVDIDRMRVLADRFNFVWISDTAEAVGSRSGRHHAGYGAHFTILSFNGNKIITTSGGGALACSNTEHAVQARFLATQARDPMPYYQHTTFGYNYRLSGVCAAIGVGQLEVLEDRVRARRAIADAYQNHLSGIEGVTFHTEPEGGRSNRWLTTIEVDAEKTGTAPDAIRLALEAHDIESRPLWKPMHLQPVFTSYLAFGGGVGARAFERGLCLPSGSAMSLEDVERVAVVMKRAMRR